MDYDDWYLYAIEDGKGFVYGIIKMREQENDLSIDGDEDVPTVGVPFISADIGKLFCFNDIKIFKEEVDRVVKKPEVKHNSILQKNFSNPKSKAGYLVADLYIEKIISYYPDGMVSNESIKNLMSDFNETKRKMEEAILIPGVRSMYIGELNRIGRIPNALLKINKKAGYRVFDSKTGTVTVKDVNNLTHYEKQAILAIHTGNVNYNSFVAEIKFHANACVSWEKYFPLLGKKWYSSTMRSDMGLDEEAESGVYDRYYNLNNKIVKEQEKIHGKK